jgi:threonine synthase
VEGGTSVPPHVGTLVVPMKYVSTRGGSTPVSFAAALFAGLAADGGLYVPESTEPLPLEHLRGATLADVGAEIAAYFAGEDIPRATLQRLIASALDFPVPLVRLDDSTWALELFHGPTFAFKDVGARVMARLMAQLSGSDRVLTVLVATSGDTGSAVADAFFGVPGTRVVVLFPHAGVTPIQEAQFTTLGGNVTAVAVDGAFDDCQRLVKEAFADGDLRNRAGLTSANSINIGRLVPQVFYYVHAALQFDASPPLVSVPSGNFGNLTAGLFAQRLGARIHRFVAGTTVNDTLPRYLDTSRYEPRASVPTLANAMDVGIRWLFNDDVAAMRSAMTTSVQTDAQVRGAIRDLWTRHGYVADPHTAIAYSALSAGDVSPAVPRVFLATAHPAKFRDIVEPIIGEEVPLPRPLADALARDRSVERIAPTLAALRELL